MTLRCPVCRAENTSGPPCRRCRADLSLLAAVEARREFHFTRARDALRDGQLAPSRHQLDRAEELPAAPAQELPGAEDLRPGPDPRRVRACLLLLAGDFPAAWAGYAATHFTMK